MHIDTKFNVGDEVYIFDLCEYNGSPYAKEASKIAHITRDIISEIIIFKDVKGDIKVSYHTEKSGFNQSIKEEFVCQSASDLTRLIIDNV